MARPTSQERVAALHAQARADYGTPDERAARRTEYDEGIARAQSRADVNEAVAVALAGGGRS
ncbi:hypothetical protein PV341_38075 [Streptomyces sp. PA03-1a]|nr:hypothetical protein [Streptomyces sp. PA03-1a]MDX2813373.1 hypothetical protein [Streptomyces sp. PA03-5A]